MQPYVPAQWDNHVLANLPFYLKLLPDLLNKVSQVVTQKDQQRGKDAYAELYKVRQLWWCALLAVANLFCCSTCCVVPVVVCGVAWVPTV